MLDMGFRRRSSGSSAAFPKERQTMLFSATLDGEVGELADDVHATIPRASRPRRGDGATTA